MSKSDPINQTKSEIRKRMRALLPTLSGPQRHGASVAACARLIGLEALQHAHTVMLYMPLEYEVDVTPVALHCFRSGQTVCVPKVDWTRREIEPVEVTSLDDHVMDCDEHGVRTPKRCRPVHPGVIDMVVVPGLAFDPQGNRLGRGGGYYDRFLARVKASTTLIGLAFDQQIVDGIPTKPHDIAMNIVITDRRVTQPNAFRTRA